MSRQIVDKRGRSQYGKKTGNSHASFWHHAFANDNGVLWVIALFIVFSIVTVFVNPLFESTDEIRHYRFIRILVTEKRLPVQGVEPLRAQSHHPPLYYLSSALLSAWVPSDHTGLFEMPVNPHWGFRNWEVGVDNKLQYLHPSGEPLHLANYAAYIPRMLNVLYGALTVALTYSMGVRIWPDKKRWALAATAFVAYNPQFIYLSAAMNNDILAALTGTSILYACVTMLQKGLSRRRLISLGLLYGLAILSKIHLVAFAPVIVLTLGFALWRNRTQDTVTFVRRWVISLFVIFAVAGVLTGWWFSRNLILYGDLTGMGRLNEMWGGRSASGHLWALQQGLPYLWTSLWGRFGYGQIPLPEPFYMMVGFITIVGVIGALRFRRNMVAPPTALVLLSAVVLFMVVVSYYVLIQPAGAMGRFLFPVLPAFSLVVVAGWMSLLPITRGLPTIAVIGMVCYALCAFGFVLLPALRAPSGDARGNPPVAQLGDVAQISDIEMDTAVVSPGEMLTVSVRWHPLSTTPMPVTVYVHVIDEVGALVAQRDTYPGLGRAPTTRWRVGRPFVDHYRIEIPEGTYSPNTAAVTIGMYTATERLAVFDADNGKLLPEGIRVGEITLVGKAGTVPNPVDVNFDNQIQLAGYTITPRRLRAGESFTLTLYWKTSTSTEVDYNVFAQVLDQDWHVWGSQDGGHPDWNQEGLLTEERVITLLPDTPTGTYPIQVGLFSAEERLPIIASDGRYLDDRFFLGPIVVE